MSTSRSADARRRSLRLHTRLALGVLALGLGLLAYMIPVEGEPGALPLLLVLVGTLGYGVSRLRLRRLAAA